MARPTKQQRSAETQQKLIDAAIELTTMFGVYGWTLRDVKRHAGQQNNSVVQYHYGSKENLLEAAIDYVLGRDEQTDLSQRDYRLGVVFLAHIVASNVASLVTAHQKVLETIGREGSPGQKKWALELLEEAFLDVPELIPGGAA